MRIKILQPWDIKANNITPRDVYMDRRRFMAKLLEASVASVGLVGCQTTGERVSQGVKKKRVIKKPPCDDPWSCGLDPNQKGFVAAKRHPRYRVDDREMTSSLWATSYNNFYEFSTNKGKVWRQVSGFDTTNWKIEVRGLCAKPMTFDLDDLRKLPHQERVYRFRCVERWAMVVPWTGFRLRDLLRKVQPLRTAKYVRFISCANQKTMPGMRQQSWLPWPYHEGLRMDEAMHDLTLMATGIYGKPLPRQNGAPVRLVVPWKYGFKSAKSIVKIELVAKKPRTFWQGLQPSEYGFYANVEPDVAHPRWPQTMETLLGSTKPIKTLRFNGYGPLVSSMYSALESGR